MKRIVFPLVVLLCIVSITPISAQSLVSGTVTYEMASVSRMNLGGREVEQVMDVTLIADFSGKYCRETAILHAGAGGSGIELSGIPPAQKYYVPHEKTHYQLTPVKGKNYAIRAEPKMITDLVMTGRIDSLLGFPCLEFTCKSNGDEVTGWYSPDLPAIVCSGGALGLPGGILKLVAKNYSLVVTDIKAGATISEADLKLPADVIKISALDFAKEMLGH